jgi:DNA-binding response OmpR family regulator
MKRKGEFAVLSIGSGAQAITMAADASPDLVVLDLSLSGAAGAVA